MGQKYEIQSFFLFLQAVILDVLHIEAVIDVNAWSIIDIGDSD